MKRLTLPLTLAAASALAACAMSPETRMSRAQNQNQNQNVQVASAATVPTGGTVRSGLGRVGAPMLSTTPVDGSANQTVTMNMQDGSKQTLTLTGGQLRMGELVEIRSDNRVWRFAQQ
jgi:hypothetical protein